jgi:hypothetical protein
LRIRGVTNAIRHLHPYLIPADILMMSLPSHRLLLA